MNTFFCTFFRFILTIRVEFQLFFSDLSPHTAELLFEIYDHSTKPHKFLGLGIVGVEELLINPSQRQIITLQSRPYETDPITGTLTVEVNVALCVHVIVQN